MIEIRFIPDDWERIDTWAGLFITELWEGKTIIRIGCSNIDGFDNDIKKGYLRAPYRKHQSFNELVEGTTEETITHETIHLIIYAWEGLEVCGLFDSIDRLGEISNPGF